MRIAILGAGFAGLATCWHLLQRGVTDITLFDAQVASAASTVSAGLLHAFTGMDARLAWRGKEALQTTVDLLQRVERESGAPVAARTGILRVATTERQRNSFLERSRQYAELRWLTAEETAQRIPGLAEAPGLLIDEGWVVKSREYLGGLWNMCERQGAQFERRSIEHLADVGEYDRVVVTTGAGTVKLLPILPIKLLKGQTVELAWPSDIPPLSMPINSDVYIIASDDRRSCLVGATFERSFSSPDPDVSLAEALLRPKAEALLPALRGAKLLDCRSGVRATTSAHTPLMGRLDAKTWLLTALGSKGLLHHAYLANLLAEAVVNDDPTLL